MRPTVPLTLAFLAVAGAGGAHAASAVQKECSAKYQAAKSGGTLAGMTYNQFYSQCAKEAREAKAGGSATPAATAAPATAPAPAAPTATAAPAAPAITAAPSAPAAAGGAVFPTAVSTQFSKESAGKARMHTCLAQYNANKTTNGNGGLRWIQKGGGYYSECNKKLKG